MLTQILNAQNHAASLCMPVLKIPYIFTVVVSTQGLEFGFYDSKEKANCPFGRNIYTYTIWCYMSVFLIRSESLERGHSHWKGCEEQNQGR